MAYAFNGSTKRITLPTGMVVLDLIDLHSRWKDWVSLGNAGFAKAFSTIGGETSKIPLYLFLSNGWKIIPQSANHVLSVSQGILETDDASEPFVDPAGSYSIRINRESPGIAIGYSSTGGSGASTAEVVAGLLVALAATPLSVNVASIKGQAVIGEGTGANPWRPA